MSFYPLFLKFLRSFFSLISLTSILTHLDLYFSLFFLKKILQSNSSNSFSGNMYNTGPADGKSSARSRQASAHLNPRRYGPPSKSGSGPPRRYAALRPTMGKRSVPFPSSSCDQPNETPLPLYIFPASGIIGVLVSRHLVYPSRRAAAARGDPEEGTAATVKDGAIRRRFVLLPSSGSRGGAGNLLLRSRVVLRDRGYTGE